VRGGRARSLHAMADAIPRDLLTLRVFGAVEAHGPGGTFAPGRSRPGALLALLLVNAGRTVSADRLLEELWPHDREPGNPKRLHVNVTRLRQALARIAPDDGPVIRTRPGGYALDIDVERVDALRFEHMLLRGRMALEARDAARAARELRAALGLWRGDAYAGYDYEPFAVPEVRRLEDLRLAAVEDWAQAELEVGAHARIASELEQFVRRHPLRERVRALLMLALYRCRRQGDALACYQAGRSAIVDELGIEPGIELRQLEWAILEQSPALEWAGASLCPAGPLSLPPVASEPAYAA
jgi:DNA-binding SARP family transcriptional activator